jgi:hypothetical protein
MEMPRNARGMIVAKNSLPYNRGERRRGSEEGGLTLLFGGLGGAAAGLAASAGLASAGLSALRQLAHEFLALLALELLVAGFLVAGFHLVLLAGLLVLQAVRS